MSGVQIPPGPLRSGDDLSANASASAQLLLSMKILFFCRYFYPHIGGVEKHVLEISKILLRKGYKITVVAEQDSKEEKKKETYKGITIHRIPVGENEWLKKWRVWLWLFRHEFLIERADVVHCHDVFFWYFPFRFFYPFKKVYITFHGYESYPIRKKAIIIRKISEWFSFGNICVGDFIAKWYGTKPTFVIDGGVKIQNSKINPFDKLRVRNQKYSKNSAVFIGRLDEQTNILEYAKAVRLLRKKLPDFKLSIVGEGKYKEQLSDMIVLGAKENPEKYFSSHRFAFVSRYLSILEAMAVKRLVFALYDNPIKKDYLKMAPFSNYIIICSNARDLYKRVLFYINNPQLEKKLVDKAYAFVQNYTWQKATNNYISLWK